MILELPRPYLGQTHVKIIETRAREARVDVEMLLGVLDATDVFVTPDHTRLAPIKRLVRGAEYAAFVRNVARQGAPDGEWRLRDLLEWLVRFGVVESTWVQEGF
jgi:hypothetical protein